MDTLPTTPEQRSLAKESSHSLDLAIAQCPTKNLKVHPHGLSVKKHTLETVSQIDSPLANNHDFNISLDHIRRGGGPEGNNAGDVDLDDKLNALDQIDINKMFPNAGHCEINEPPEENKLMLMNQSPIRLELSSPIKRGNSNEDNQEEGKSEPNSKRLKLGLESVPNLTQTAHDQQLNELPLSSPEAIEMIDTKSSPMKEFSDLEIEQRQEEQRPTSNFNDSAHQFHTEESTVRTPDKTHDKSENILSIPRLTPVFHRSSMEASSNRKFRGSIPCKDNINVTSGHDFHIITTRNQELIDEIHSMNKRLNIVTADYDLALHEYRTIKVQLESASSKYETEIDTLNGVVKEHSSEQSKLEAKINKLKQRLNESRDEISMLNQNQSILQKKYESATKEADRWKRLSNEIEGSFLEMRDSALERQTETQEMEKEIVILSEKIDSYETIRLEAAYVNDVLEKQITNLEEQLSKKAEEATKLEALLNESVASQKGASEQITNQLEELISKKHELELQVKSIHNTSKDEIATLKEILSEKEFSAKSTAESLNAVQSTCNRLEMEVTEKDKRIDTMQKDYEELNDESEIRKAEIVELNSTIEELKECNLRLETSVSQSEEKIKELKKDLDREKTSPDRETEYLKSVNIEAEHLAELEELHANLSSLQESLKKNSEVICQLKEENQNLKKTLSATESPAENDSKETRITSLLKEIDEWRNKYNNKEQESNKSLKLLAEDLYVQYSSKHEQKVKLLKKGYETKYQGRLDKQTLKNEGLTQEIDHLKSQLASERKEKQKLLNLIDTNKMEKDAAH